MPLRWRAGSMSRVEAGGTSQTPSPPLPTDGVPDSLLGGVPMGSKNKASKKMLVIKNTPYLWGNQKKIILVPSLEICMNIGRS